MKTLWSLLAVAILLAGAIVFVDRDRPSTDERRAQRTRLVPALETTAVGKLTIVRRPGGTGEERFTLVRQPAGEEPPWRVDGPQGAARPADAAAVTDLLTALDFAEVERTAEIDPAAAGLEPPSLRLEIDAPKGQVVLELGRLDASGRGVFVRSGGDPAIRVGPKRLLDLANREATAFRDRRLVPARPDEVTAIAWEQGLESETLRLVEGRWRNARGEPVATERVAEALRRILALRAARYVEPAPDSRPGPARRLRVVGSQTIELALPPDVAEGGAVRREGEGAILEAPETVSQLWPALRAAAARDDRLVSNPRDSVTRVELTDGTRRLVLRRIGGAWTIGPPQVDYEADREVVEAWLAKLHEARPALGPVGAGARRLVVEGRYREAVAVSTPKEAFAELEPDPLRFRDRRVLSFARLDVRRLARRSARGGASVEAIRDDSGTWRLKAPTGSEPDAAGIARVVGLLADLRAESYEEAPPRGVATSILEVDVLPPGETASRRHVLELYPLGRAGCRGRLNGTATFRLAADTCEGLGAALSS